MTDEQRERESEQSQPGDPEVMVPLATGEDGPRGWHFHGLFGGLLNRLFGIKE